MTIRMQTLSDDECDILLKEWEAALAAKNPDPGNEA